MKQYEGEAGIRFLAGLCGAGEVAPIARPLHVLAGAPPALTADACAPLIYVVDNDEAFRDSLRWLLESVSYRVTTYSSAERFLEDYEPGAAACLILDVRLPGMSGLDLQQELKRRGESLPIIFISAHGGVPAAVDAIKGGASHFLEKPFAEAQLHAAIEQARARSTNVNGSSDKPSS